MGDQIKNIVITYQLDDSDLKKSLAALSHLSNEEKEAVEQFKKINAEAAKASQSVSKGTKDASSSVNQLNASLKTVGGAIAGYFSVQALLAFGQQVIAITSEFQRFEAVLSNTLGSNSAAQRALVQIQDFAAKTPFSVQEVTEAFLKLANSGLKPTTDDLKSFADLAANAGKGMDQFAEAVNDATRFEFERLKEFFIDASVKGNKVALSFKGQTVEVDKNAEAIKRQLVAFGKLPGVMGATDAISKTLTGQLNNLGDSFSQLYLVIGKNTEGVLSKSIKALNYYLQLITTAAKSSAQIDEEVIGADVEKYLKKFRTLNEAQQKDAVGLLEGNVAESQRIISDEQRKRLEQAKASAYNLNRLSESQNKDDIALYNRLLKDRYNSIEKSQAEQDAALYLKTNQARYEAVQDLFKQAEQATEAGQKKLTDKELDGLRDAELRRLNELEAIAIREAKLKDASENEILEIVKKYAGLRLEVQRRSVNDYKGEQLTILESAKQQEENLLDIDQDRVDQRARLDKVLSGDLINNATGLFEFGKKLRDDEEKEEAKARKDKEKAEEEHQATLKKIRQEAFAVGQQLVETGFQLFQQDQQRQLDELQGKKAMELALVGDNAQARAFIEKKFAKQAAEIKTKQAAAERDAAIFQIIITTAQKIVESFPVVPLMALAGALGAAQLAVVATRPLPKFATGVIDLDGPGTSTSDSILARLSRGESVMTAMETQKYKSALEAMRSGIDPDVFNKRIDFDRLGKMAAIVQQPKSNEQLLAEIQGLRKDMKKMKQVNVSFDKKGMTVALQQQNSVTEILNNQFNA